MKEYIIGLIGGDGIGIEVVNGAKIVLMKIDEVVNVINLDLKSMDVSESAFKKFGDPFPEETKKGIADSDAVLFGAAGGEFNVPVINGIRVGFDLYAKVCPIKTLPGSGALYKNVDMVVMRENIEGLYRGIGYIDGDYHVNLRTFTKPRMERYLRFCFEYARKNGRKKITFTHKAQILRHTDKPMMDLFYQIAKEYPEIIANDIHIDTCAMLMVLDPTKFDVVVCENANGDIMSDLGAGLVGGLGFAYNGNIGDNKAVFEPTHGTGPDIAGQNISNPMAAILSAKMMFEYLGEVKIAEVLEKSLQDVLVEGKVCTPDIGGKSSTTEVSEAIAEKFKQIWHL